MDIENFVVLKSGLKNKSNPVALDTSKVLSGTTVGLGIRDIIKVSLSAS